MSSVANEDGAVEVFLWEPSGVNRPQWPITFGVPFPKGALADKDQIRLRDGDRELAVASRVTAQWPDGSVRWLLLDFQVDLLGNGRRSLALDYGPGVKSSAKASTPVKVVEEGDAVSVTAGDLEVRFRQGGRMPFDDVIYKGRSALASGAAICAVTEKGKTFEAMGDSVRVTVEDRNDLRVVVRCDGKFAADDGTTCLDLTTRVYAFAGQAFLKIYHTITNKEGRDVLIDDLSFRVSASVDNVDSAYVTGQGLDDSIHPAEQGAASLSVKTVPIPETAEPRTSREVRRFLGPCPEMQEEVLGLMERRAAGHCAVRTGDGAEKEILGSDTYWPIVASGLVQGQGLGVALSCRDFHPQAPKRLGVDGTDVELSLYWNFEDSPLRLWRGAAKTHELHLLLTDGAELADRDAVLRYKRRVMAAQEPVAPTYGASNWLQKTEVMGPLLDFKPEQYRWTEFMFRRIFEQWFLNPAGTLRGSTLLDYGDYWHPRRAGQWMNNEMDFGNAMILFMLRTGYPRPWGSIETIIHHMIDVDTHHEAEDPLWVGAQCVHSPLHGVRRGFGLCHEWLEGPLYYYLLTGYERAREVTLMRADHMARAVAAGREYASRVQAAVGPMVGT